jgi:hypothetical protein
MTEWHRAFGGLLIDLFTGSPFVVDLEKDLSLQKQLLDVVILRKSEGSFAGELPDGLEDLGPHNLITFKSFQEALDDWSLKELTGHYVNYRKQLVSRREPLLPESEFRLYAICSRYPQNLAREVGLQQVQDGVYWCRRGSDVFTVIVLRQLPQTERNAGLLLLSGVGELGAYGFGHYRLRSETTSTLLYHLFKMYRKEGLMMPYTIEDFQRDIRRGILQDLTPEERRKALEGLTPAERREVLEGLTPAERREVLEGLSPEERVEDLSTEQLEQILETRKASQPSGRRKPQRRK